MKYVWILTYYHQRGLEVQNLYFTSEEKAKAYAKEKEMPKSAVRYEINPASIN